MNSTLFFSALWKQYADKTPSAHKVKSLLEKENETVYNDHIAIRTFDDPRTNIEVIAKPFLSMGYKEMGEYHFEAKKLYAKHYENLEDPDAPKIFISQLLTAHFSEELQSNVKNILDACEQTVFDKDDLVLKGRVWETPSYEIYQSLQEESEYAAWMYVNGFCSNHFTVDVNKLKNFENLHLLNDFLKDNGFAMNTSGGEIKGTPEQFLEQSSILADKIEMEFVEGIREITSCYYEFAFRYTQDNGKLFTGFIANSADKIFESTDMKLQKTQ
ncbi:2-oxoadipate dioxygenase/decarboxylase family protein [Aquimarina sp. 433]